MNTTSSQVYAGLFHCTSYIVPQLTKLVRVQYGVALVAQLCTLQYYVHRTRYKVRCTMYKVVQSLELVALLLICTSYSYIVHRTRQPYYVLVQGTSYLVPCTLYPCTQYDVLDQSYYTLYRIYICTLAVPSTSQYECKVHSSTTSVHRTLYEYVVHRTVRCTMQCDLVSV